MVKPLPAPITSIAVGEGRDDYARGDAVAHALSAVAGRPIVVHTHCGVRARLAEVTTSEVEVVAKSRPMSDSSRVGT